MRLNEYIHLFVCYQWNIMVGKYKIIILDVAYKFLWNIHTPHKHNLHERQELI
jgi:hypothetical protein